MPDEPKAIDRETGIAIRFVKQWDIEVDPKASLRLPPFDLERFRELLAKVNARARERGDDLG